MTGGSVAADEGEDGAARTANAEAQEGDRTQKTGADRYAAIAPLLRFSRVPRAELEKRAAQVGQSPKTLRKWLARYRQDPNPGSLDRRPRNDINTSRFDAAIQNEMDVAIGRLLRDGDLTLQAAHDELVARVAALAPRMGWTTWKTPSYATLYTRFLKASQDEAHATDDLDATVHSPGGSGSPSARAPRRMSLLHWNASIDVLSRTLQQTTVNVLLGRCVLWLPGGPTLKRDCIECSAQIRIDPSGGFEVHVQGAVPERLHIRMQVIAFGMEINGPFLLRGADAEGAMWFIRTPSLRNLAYDDDAGMFQATLAPRVLSIRAPATCEATVANGALPAIELLIDSELRLPPIDLTLTGKTAVERRHRDEDRGALEAHGMQVVHRAEGLRRVVTSPLITGIGTARQVTDLVDAIGFVNGRRAWPMVTRVTTRRGRTLHIHRPLSDNAAALPPLVTAAHRPDWEAFGAFLLFLRGERDGGRAQLSARLSDLHDASTPTYVSSRALMASVAVEGLVNAYIQAPARMSSADAAAASAQVEATDLPEKLKRRCKQIIGDWTRATAAERLRLLSKQGVVDDESVRTWSTHRPKLAHGNRSRGSEDLAGYFAAVTLFHGITLALIGVETRYPRRVVGDPVVPLQSKPLPPALRQLARDRPRRRGR